MRQTMDVSRRTLVKGAFALGASAVIVGGAVGPRRALADDAPSLADGANAGVQYGFLVYASKCVNCEKCVAACRTKRPTVVVSRWLPMPRARRRACPRRACIAPSPAASAYARLVPFQRGRAALFRWTKTSASAASIVIRRAPTTCRATVRKPWTSATAALARASRRAIRRIACGRASSTL